MVTVLLALAAAFAFGAAVALQQRAAAQMPRAHALRSTLLTRLVRRPIWLAGLAASATGFVLQMIALRRGALVVVQPVMTATLVFALALIALTRRARLHLSECAALAAVLAGLATFLVLAAPDTYSVANADAAAWWVLGATVTAVTGIAAITALRVAGATQAAWLGLAAGLSNGFVAVLTKAFAGDLHHGARLLLNWPLWALAAAGIPALLLVQTAYQAGHLRVSLPIIAVVEPVLACTTGIALFHEHLRIDGARAVGIIAAALLCGLGLVRLARNPQISADRQDPHRALTRPHGTGSSASVRITRASG
jgi:drug/metabolite transporter (DMT)-like permease